jgi:UDP-N-acetylglucosamine acyltransferase
MVSGNPAAARSMNYEGLRRRGFSAGRIAAVKAMHKAIYRDELTLEQARERIAGLAQTTPEAAADVEMMVSFLANVSPQRGIVR